jgi:hypothetical protein
MLVRIQTPDALLEEQNMANYFYKWAPLLIVGTVVLLGLPWLGLLALIFVVTVLLGALAALGLAIVSAIAALSRTVRRGMAPALSPLRSSHRSAPLVPTAATVFLARTHPEREA